LDLHDIYTPELLESTAKALFSEEREIKRLDGWFLVSEINEEVFAQNPGKSETEKKAFAQLEVARRLPLSISKNNVFAGTQRDAFAKSYALINPNFKVSTFNGYCDPTAVFDDIEPNAEFPVERINNVREAVRNRVHSVRIEMTQRRFGRRRLILQGAVRGRVNFFVDLVRDPLEHVPVHHAFFDQEAWKPQNRVALGLGLPLGRCLVEPLIIG
jgi:hypothetical protein